MTYLIYGGLTLFVYVVISLLLYNNMRKLRKTRYIPPQTVYEWNSMSVIWPGYIAFIIFGIVYGCIAAIISFIRDKFR